MGGFEDTGAGSSIWLLPWAMFAVVVGVGLAAAAATFWRRLGAMDRDLDFTAGYNALAPLVDRAAPD